MEHDEILRRLTECRLVLVDIWNDFRQLLTQRGYATEDILHEVAIRCLLFLSQPGANSPSNFCAWAGSILRNLCLEKLRAYRRWPVALPAGVDPPDGSTQQREMMHAALLLGLARLSPTNRALVEARYAQEVHLSLDRVATFLQETHPNIWQANSEAWSPHERLSEACGLAFQQLNIEANHCLRLLEGGADECASA